MTANYQIWQADPNGGFCCLTHLQNVPRTFDIANGVSREQGFPADAQFQMNPAYPKDVMLPDNFSNLEGFAVVSNRLKTFLEGKEIPAVEYLQVAIVNHKGRLASPDCFILNPLTVQDCIDVSASQVKWNAIDRSILSLNALVLDDTKIDPRFLLFRPAGLLEVILVHRDLASELVAQQFTGLRFVECEDFRG
jgi:hypothetical protein